MKNLFLSLLIVFMAIGCRTTKKTTEIKEKAVQEEEIVVKEKTEVVAEKKTEEKTKENTVATNTETVVKYTPKINEVTGKFEPFKMVTKKDGKENSVIEIDGNGEVYIRSILDGMEKSSEQIKSEIDILKQSYEADIKAKKQQLYEKEEEIVKKERSIFNLYLIIIALTIALLISIYYNFKPKNT